MPLFVNSCSARAPRPAHTRAQAGTGGGDGDGRGRASAVRRRNEPQLSLSPRSGRRAPEEPAPSSTDARRDASRPRRAGGRARLLSQYVCFTWGYQVLDGRKNCIISWTVFAGMILFRSCGSVFDTWAANLESIVAPTTCLVPFFD